MNDKLVKKIICFGLLIFFVTCIVIIYIISNKSDNISNEEHKIVSDSYAYSDVYDINEYQTIYETIKKYLSNLNNKNYILNIILKSYKEMNDITESNLGNFTEDYFGEYSYDIEKIEKYYNSYFSIFLVSGSYSLESYESIIKTINIKDIVIFDKANNTFAVVPINSNNKDFKSIILNYNLENFNEVISKNDNNEIEFIRLAEANEVLMYLNKYLNLMVINCSSAYTKLVNNSSDTKMSYEDFSTLCENFQTGKYSTVLKKYQIKNSKDGIKYIEIEDYNSLKYEFIINSVLNYTVSITK